MLDSDAWRDAELGDEVALHDLLVLAHRRKASLPIDLDVPQPLASGSTERD